MLDFVPWNKFSKSWVQRTVAGTGAEEQEVQFVQVQACVTVLGTLVNQVWVLQLQQFKQESEGALPQSSSKFSAVWHNGYEGEISIIEWIAILFPILFVVSCFHLCIELFSLRTILIFDLV